MKPIFSIIGVILFILSAQPLFLIGRELYYERSVEQDFKIENLSVNFSDLGKVEILGKGTPIPVENIRVKNYIINGSEYIPLTSMEDYGRMIAHSSMNSVKYLRDYSWNGNTIRMEDQFHPGVFHEDSRQTSNVRITINNMDRSSAAPIEIRPNYLDNNRYHGYFGILLVEKEGKEEIVLVQRISGPDFKNEKDLAWRTVRIEKNGQVHEDRFTYDERGDVPHRVDFVNKSMTSPISLGYRSNILKGWPTIFFPFLYPFGTGIIGLLLTLIGIIWRNRKVY